MTDKKKKRAKALSTKTGMSHQAAVNVLTPNEQPKFSLPKNFLPEFPNWNALEAEVDRLTRLGFEVIPCDTPQEGRIGYFATAKLLNGNILSRLDGVVRPIPTSFLKGVTAQEFQEVEIQPGWYPWGSVKPRITRFDWGGSGDPSTFLVCDDSLYPRAKVEIPYFIEHLERISLKQLFRADDPKRRLLGYVFYEDGYANITYIGLTAAKALGNKTPIHGKHFSEWYRTALNPRDILLMKIGEVPGVLNF